MYTVKRSPAALRRGLVMACVSMLPIGTAWGQDNEEEVEEIIVTGTRIPEPNLVSTSPIQVVDAEQIKVSGRNDLSDVLQLLPQNFSNTLGQGLGNTTSGLTVAGGVSNLDLRGLGPSRTLVLVNGRRLGAGSPNTAIQSPAPNPDQIPAQLVERIDVVTGGASAVYGSDAIAGVVNFVLKRNFEGLQFDGQYGFNYHDNENTYMQQAARDFGVTPETGTNTDGAKRSFSVLGGSSTGDGRGNFTGYLSYQDQDPVRSGDRDYGACQLFNNTDGDNVPLGGAYCDGSANSNLFIPVTGPQADEFFGVFGDEFVPWFSEETTPPPVFNSQRFINISREFERYNAGFLGHYDLNDHVNPYVEFTFSNDRTHQEIAPSALFLFSNPLTVDGNYLINCSNPLLSDQQRSTLCSAAQITADTAAPGSALASVAIGRRNVEGGGRTADYEHSNYRAVLGTTGDIASGWTYDLYGQYYYTNFYNSNDQYLNFQKITNALQVTTDDDGNPVCISGGSCVPYNIFSDGGVTGDALDYLYTSGTAYGTTKLGTVHFDVTGRLDEYGIKLPTADDGVAINVGYEKRHERVDFAPDDAELSGLLSGFGGASAAIDQGVDVEEWSAETRIPLISGMTGIYDLTFDAGYRHSDYSTTGGEDTYKFEVQYAPVAGARLRASFNKAIRAPSIVELFNPPIVGQITFGTDPCAATRDADTGAVIPAAASLGECLNTVRPDQYADFTAAYGNGGTTNTIPQGTASQLSQLQGGNENLVPEEADTYTIGLTITPELVPQFTASIDYYHIELDDQVGVLPAAVIVEECLENADPVFCPEIVRQPTTFSLQGASPESGGYIKQLNRNIAAVEASGIDVQAAYELELPRALGSLDFQLAGTYVLTYESTPYPGADTYDCAGLFGFTCQTVNPEWKHTFRTTWQTPWDVSVALTWRFIDRVKLDNNDSEPLLNNSSFNGYNAFNAEIASFSYWDLALTYAPGAVENLEVRAGINNLADEDPPIVTSEIISGGGANTYESYDYFGRQIFVGFTLKL